MNLKLELIVKLGFRATHTLEENDAIHEHRWRVDTTLAGTNRVGRVISLPLAQSIFREVLAKLEGTHLNSNCHLDGATREVPTCENLVYFLFDEFSRALSASPSADPSLRIVGIEVAVSENDFQELGSARLRMSS